MTRFTDSTLGLGTHILLVEKDPLTADSVGHFFEQAGHRVTTVYNGKEAFAAAVELRPDAVLTEIILPGMNGLELCRKLASSDETRDIPVVVFSVVLAEKRAKDKGAARYLLKPIKQSDLVREVESVIEDKAKHRDR